MVTSLARQAVIIKSGNDTSILTGNYELAYALGFLANQTGISIPEGDVEIRDLQERILEELKYNPDPAWDAQMAELLRLGLSEKCPWDFHRA